VLTFSRAHCGPYFALRAREPHAKAKHDLIEKYLGGWIPILGRLNARIAHRGSTMSRLARTTYHQQERLCIHDGKGA
jgi:hypothetical protein